MDIYIYIYVSSELHALKSTSGRNEIALGARYSGGLAIPVCISMRYEYKDEMVDDVRDSGNEERKRKMRDWWSRGRIERDGNTQRHRDIL